MAEVEAWRRIPLVMNMLLWTGENLDQMLLFTDGNFRVRPSWSLAGRGMVRDDVPEVYDVLHDTWIKVEVGHRIVEGIQGEFYPIEQVSLDGTYERVS